jgi:hypothetical protein
MSRYSFCAVAVAVALALAPGAARAADEPKDVVAKAVKAHGGEEYLKKHAAHSSVEKGKIDLPGVGEVDFTSETAFMLPNKFRQTMSFSVMNQNVSITIKVLGDTVFGETAVGGMNIDISKDVKDNIKDVPHLLEVGQLYPLLGKDYALATFGEEKVNGKPAVGITVSKKGQNDITLFFDKETHLMVRMDSRSKSPMGGAEVNETRIFEEYGKTKDGVPYAKKLLVKHDGKDFMKAEVSDVQYLEKLPDADFKK